MWHVGLVWCRWTPGSRLWKRVQTRQLGANTRGGLSASEQLGLDPERAAGEGGSFEANRPPRTAARRMPIADRGHPSEAAGGRGIGRISDAARQLLLPQRSHSVTVTGLTPAAEYSIRMQVLRGRDMG